MLLRFPFQFVPLVATVVVGLVPLRRSDPVGVFAIVDRIVVEGDTANPTAIQVWGVFALTTGSAGYEYKPAQRGYLYYSVNQQNRRATLAEWSDLKTMAGTGQALGFGGRYVSPGRIRGAGEAARSPDTYPLGVGVAKMGTLPIYGADGSTRTSVERELAAVPAQVSPAEGAVVPAGPVRLAVRNVALAGVQYRFDIAAAGANATPSPAVAAGQRETSWTTPAALRPGVYSWRAWVTNGTWRGQPTTGSFRVR